MTLREFLLKESYAYRISILAIVVQTIITASLIFFFLSDSFVYRKLILLLLCLDVGFICFHLAYRLSYAGPKVETTPLTRFFLVLHSAFALLGIAFTIMFFFNPDSVALPVIFWILSLISGGVFFSLKYQFALSWSTRFSKIANLLKNIRFGGMTREPNS